MNWWYNVKKKYRGISSRSQHLRMFSLRGKKGGTPYTPLDPSHVLKIWFDVTPLCLISAFVQGNRSKLVQKLNPRLRPYLRFQSLSNCFWKKIMFSRLWESCSSLIAPRKSFDIIMYSQGSRHPFLRPWIFHTILSTPLAAYPTRKGKRKSRNYLLVRCSPLPPLLPPLRRFHPTPAAAALVIFFPRFRRRRWRKAKRTRRMQRHLCRGHERNQSAN